MNGSLGPGLRLLRCSACAWLLFAGLLGSDAGAQTCGDTFLGQGNPTQLILVDESTNPFTFPVLGTAAVGYNALAYRPANDTLYAVQAGTTTLVEVELDGSLNALGTVAGLPSAPPGWIAGAFAPDGFLYLARGGGDNLYRVDVDALTATEITLSQLIGIPDIAWFDGLFYGVTSGGLTSIDPVTGTVTELGGPFTGGTGAMFSSSNGVFGVRNDGSGFYQFDITTGDATLISDAPGSSTNDGARCLNAPFELDADLSVAKTDNSPTYLPETDVVYDIVVTNNGPFGVQNAPVSDPLPAGITTASWTCTGAAGGVCGSGSGSGAIVDTPDLPVGASVTYTYTVAVPADFSGDLVNTVTVELPEGFTDPTPADNSATDVDTSAAAPSISLDKSGSGPDPLNVGGTVNYSFGVTNTGNVTLINVTVTDSLPGLSPISCPTDTLGPGAAMTCTATYTVTQADADAGFVGNTAMVTGDPFSGPPVSDQDAAVVPPSQEPGISIQKSGSAPEPPGVGDTVQYAFLITNTGNLTLANVTASDPLPGLSPISCPATTLAPTETMTCTGSYTVTQADLDAGSVQNMATVTADPPGGLPPVTDESSTTVPLSRLPAIDVSKAGSGPDPLTVGATIEYTFVVINTGNVTLTGVTVTDPLPGLSAISCPGTSLASGDSMTCTASYTVTQADVDAGVIENTATVTGGPPGGLPQVTGQDSATVPPVPSVLEIPVLSRGGTLLLVLLLSAAALWALRGVLA